MPSEFWTDFRRSFVRGLATVLPTLLTVSIILYVFNFIQKRIGNRINTAIIQIIAWIKDGSGDANYNIWEKWWSQHSYLDAAGFIVAVIGIYFVGRFVASFIGRSVWKTLEQGLKRTPIVNAIYPSVKQVTDFLLSQDRLKFNRVVAAEYPRKGIWSMGLVVAEGMKTLQETTGAELLTVFIPSSPTPVTGYVITIRRDEVIDLPLTIDEALRILVSGGVLIPASQLTSASPPALAGTPIRPYGRLGAPAESK